MESFNHHMMVLARDSRGLTQAELSDRLSVGQGTLSKYETGLLEPPNDFVADLSREVNYPPSFFFEPGRQYGFPPFHYRRRKKLSKRALDRINAEMNIRRMHIQKLALSYPARSNAFIPELDRDEYHGKHRHALTPEDAARIVREAWMMPSGPIQSMMDVIEGNGGIVVPCDFGTDLIDALSQRIDGMPVLFFVNVHAPADRVRHTLAHELGHMVLHTLSVKDDDEMEEEADAFAGAFLLPAEEIRAQLRRFDLRHLANLKQYWKVSMAAIAVRAARLNLITPYQSKMFWIEMSKLGYRKREPNEPPKEVPSLLKRMVDFHLKKLEYSVSQIAELLHLYIPAFQEMYGAEFFGSPPDRPLRAALRLVK